MGWHANGESEQQWLTCISCQDHKLRDAPVECFSSCTDTPCQASSLVGARRCNRHSCKHI